VVERDDRPPVATFYVDAELAGGAVVALSDAAAHHARVKRLEIGDAIRLTDGRGLVAFGELASLGKGSATVGVERIVSVAPPLAIHLRVPIGDRDRMLWLAEKATELGVASWQAVRFRRSASVSPRGEGSAFAEKVRGRMISALEQSGGAWLPAQLADANLDAVDCPPDADRILLDGGGVPVLRLVGARPAVVVFGPEGGIESEERERLEAAGWRAATLGGTTLRFETAGVAAVAAIRAGQLTTAG